MRNLCLKSHLSGGWEVLIYVPVMHCNILGHWGAGGKEYVVYVQVLPELPEFSAENTDCPALDGEGSGPNWDLS